MTTERNLLHVASPRACNTQQTTLKPATPHATGTQQPSLKALARKALGCNTPCNTHATEAEKPCNKQGEEAPPFVAQPSAIRECLLTIARELGLPDPLVLELPESELIATSEQHHDFTTEKGEELGHKLLVFYLRSVAGIEPALPGSLAERDAPARRARWQA